MEFNENNLKEQRRELQNEIRECDNDKFEAELAVMPSPIPPAQAKEYDDRKTELEAELRGVTTKIMSGAVETIKVSPLFFQSAFEEEVKHGSLRDWWRLLTDGTDRSRRKKAALFYHHRQNND